MKKFLYYPFFVIFIFASCAKENSAPLPTSWKKMDIKTQEDLTKIIVQNNRTVIFSQKNCYTSSEDLNYWKENALPASSNPCPLLFKGKLYLNGNDGIYLSENYGESWVKVSEEIAEYFTANEERMFLINDDQIHPCRVGTIGSFTVDTALDNLVNSGYHVYRQINFCKATENTIVIFEMTGGCECTVISKDGGTTWKVANNNTLFVGDFFLTDDSKSIEYIGANHATMFEVFSETSQSTITFTSSEHRFGIFTGTTKLNGDRWLVARKFNSDGLKTGLIIKNFDINNAHQCAEPINAIASTGQRLIAIGAHGAVYIL